MIAAELTRNIELLEAMALFRLAKRHGPQVLDDSKGLDELFSWRRPTVVDRKVLAVVRRMVEGGLDDLPQGGREPSHPIAQVHQDHLDGQ